MGLSSLNVQVEFLWLNNLSDKDPFYFLPLLFLISLMVRHQLLIPHRMKFVLIVPALLLFLFSLNLPAAFHLFVIGLILLSVVQTTIIRRSYTFPSIADPAGRSSAESDDSANKSLSGGWRHAFQRKASIFLYDDIPLSLLLGIYLGLVGVVVFLLYWAYFRWRERREWAAVL